MAINKRTKIITTIGPSSEQIDVMRNLFKAGMNTIRLNFSHGDFDEHGKRIDNVKILSKEFGQPISIMLDTKGPEIRVGKFKNGKQQISSGQKITIYTTHEAYTSKVCESGEVTVSYDMAKDLEVGKIVLVDDGKLQLNVKKIEDGVIHAVARNSHLIKDNKRINLPGTKFSMPFLAKKDIEDIKFGIKKGIDFIAASFVNTPEDVQEIRNILKEHDAEHIKIFSKVESQYAVDNFDKILEATDGVMVARGDLGLEIPYYEVPVAEKMMIRKMRNAGKPVIVATQMLDSMEKNPHPTRAEVTDVYFATELGADATMLSGESAAGQYPIEAVEVMATINQRAEKEFYNKVYYDKYIKSLPVENNVRSERARLLTLKAQSGMYKYAVVLSRTGQLLSKIAQYRPNIDILGVLNDPKQITQFGVTSSVFASMDENAFNEIKQDFHLARKIVENYGAKPGDKYLVLDAHEVIELEF